MRTTPPLFEWPGRVVALCAALLPCMLPAAGASGPASKGPMQASGAQLVAVTIERDCFGCPTGRRLEVRSEMQSGGRSVTLVVFTETGKPKLGTQDRRRQALVDATELQQLASLLQTEGFGQMPPEYPSGDVQDGAWATVQAVYRQGTAELTHSVFAREGFAPPNLLRLWAALDALRDRAGLR